MAFVTSAVLEFHILTVQCQCVRSHAQHKLTNAVFDCNRFRILCQSIMSKEALC